MTQKELDGLLERFNGVPGVSGGLNHDETVAMFQALIDNKQIYKNPELCEWAIVYSEAGWVTGFNKEPPATKMSFVERCLLVVAFGFMAFSAVYMLFMYGLIAYSLWSK